MLAILFYRVSFSFSLLLPLYCLHYYLLILAVIVQILNPTTELLIPIGIPSKEAKTEIEIHPVVVEAKYESV